MNSFSEVIKKFRETFDIAADVKDTEINKCIQEADKLDIKVALCGDTFFSVSSELGGGKGESDIPAGTDSDSNYSLDVVIAGKNYNIVPLYYNKNKRWEEERGKADAFIEDFHIVYELFKESDNPKDKHCCDSVKPYRVCFIS